MNYFLTWFIINYSYINLEYLKNIKKYESRNKYRMTIRKEKYEVKWFREKSIT